MVELARNQSLYQVLLDIQKKDLEVEVQNQLAEQLKTEGMQLGVQASRLLKEYGERKQMHIGIGSGPGVVGFRVEPRTVLVTPSVPFTFEGKRLSLFITQAFDNDDYSPNSISVILEENNHKRELFRVYHGGIVANWFGEYATLEQIKEFSGVLSFAKESLQ